jgi:hypothetical protein
MSSKSRCLFFCPFVTSDPASQRSPEFVLSDRRRTVVTACIKTDSFRLQKLLMQQQEFLQAEDLYDVIAGREKNAYLRGYRKAQIEERSKAFNSKGPPKPKITSKILSGLNARLETIIKLFRQG